MRKILLTLLSLVLFNFVQAQNPVEVVSDKTYEVYVQPKLVVGIVVDQMRYDYITRFWDRYGEDGLKRMISEGYLFKNAHYNYVPTYTAPGHTSIYTGTSPRYHGIISNSFYNKTEGVYADAVSDSAVMPVGTKAEKGRRSPHRLLATTVTDQNRLHTQFRGKTIGVSMKDRAAILPAGRSASGAYWFYGKDEGHFITSTYYRNELPQWVADFNNSGKAESYMQTWNTLYPIDTYVESGADLNDYEGGFKGKETASFPYDIAELRVQNDNYDMLFDIPFGNSLTTDFALAALDGDDLGKDDITDFLTVSYSSPDYIGHNFGVNSVEVQDNYLRLDKELARLLTGLDEKVGKGNYTVFLSADHGAIHVPTFLKSEKLAAGYFKTSQLRKDLRAFAKKKYKTEEVIANISNQQVFLDYKFLEKKKLKVSKVERDFKEYLMTYPGIAQVYTRETLENTQLTRMISGKVQNGFNPKRSGDVVYVLEPGVISYPKTGSTHGSPYAYDTHIPIIFYGKGIKNGQSTHPVEIVDIAPTISALLGIAFPNATTGKVLSEAIELGE